ncbi:MAG TPA: primosomal protein N' [Candidatus Binatia bacterium]|nr:primosomal protein N' [Candidatus Binatia bacterium]
MNRLAEKFARVVIPKPLKEPLIYKVPDQQAEQIGAGMRVLIPLGKRQVTGVVLELLRETVVPKTKAILAPLDERPIFDNALLQLSQWVARYYLVTLGEVFGTLLPPILRSETRRTIILKPGTFAGSNALEKWILDRLRQGKGKISVNRLTREMAAGNVQAAIERLQSLSAVEIRERLPGHRIKTATTLLESASAQTPETQPRLILNFEQEQAFRKIEDRLKEGGFETFLLHGVTGSGKTEIYLRAMEETRRAGHGSLILIPEISLTPQLIQRLNARFPGRVGILHSALSGAERWAQWWRIVRGNVDVVVGARSAVFAPLPNLGLIIVDEEHDPSYKQEEGLRYNGRDVAVVRAKLSACPVILGSATPAIESYQNALDGRYRLLEMAQRVQQRPLPFIETIDLRSKFSESPNSNGDRAPVQADLAPAPESSSHRLISDRLAMFLRDNYRASRQSLIFLNRRGFSNFLQCAACGYALRCSYCSVTLTLHRKQKSLCCHHCNFRRSVTALCPECSNPTLSGVGVGTEHIEEALHRLVPGARIARMDRDTTSKRGSHEQLIRNWEKGQIDILVGTQMITKGHDVTGVTLVGALLADLSLNLPDFRSGERTFQLLSQVAGRSGRGDEPGTVIIQTYAPDHYAIRYLIHHDYKGFFAEEIDFRRALNYPPFSRLVCLKLESPRLDEVQKKAQMVGTTLREQIIKSARLRGAVEILGPAPAPIEKLRNRYRWQLLLKGKQSRPLLELAQRAREVLPRSHSVRLHIDVDPYNML